MLNDSNPRSTVRSGNGLTGAQGMEPTGPWQDLFSQLPLAVLLLDPHGAVVDANPACCRWLGQARERLVSRSVVELFGHGSTFDLEEGLKRVSRGDIDVLVDTLPLEGTGTRWSRIAVSPCKLGGDGLLLASLDSAADRTAEPAGGARESVASLDDAMRSHILHALDACAWKIEGQQGAAALLDLKPSTLRSRMKRLGIKRPSSR